MTVLTQTLFTGTTLSARFATLRTQLSEKAAKRAVYRTTLRELQSLTDRDLNDLGIARSMCETIAYEAAYGK